jgi:uncharacterized repeat protein (TIGR01451 family)
MYKNVLVPCQEIAEFSSMKKNTMKNTALRLICLVAIMLCLSELLYAQLERANVQIILDEQELISVRAADLDGDGDEDLIGTRNAWDGHLAYYENTDGQGALAWPVVFGDSIWGYSSGRPTQLELGDMDNDGDVDVIDALGIRTPYPYWENDGQGNFSRAGSPIPSSEWISNYDAFRVADMDGDGWLDVLYYNSSNRRLYINWNPGNGQPFVFEEVAFLNFYGISDFTDIEITDYDQDGDLDVLIFSTYQYEPVEQQTHKHLLMEVILGEGGAFSHSTSDDITFQDYEGSAEFKIDASLADLNNDGFPDLIFNYLPFAHPFDDGLSIWLRNGNGSFSSLEEFQDYQGHLIHDVNEDGHPDIIVIKRHQIPGLDEYSYEWLENDGNANFTVNFIDDQFCGLNLQLADLNTDGTADLLSFNQIGYYNSVLIEDNSQLFLRNGQSSPTAFSPPQPLTESFVSIKDITLQDMNQDGASDLLIAAGNGIRWIENVNAGASFSIPSTLWEAPGTVVSFDFTHLNSDGHIDGVGIVSGPAVHPYKPVAWLGAPGISTGSTIEFPDISVVRTNCLAFGPLNADADADLIVVNPDGALQVLWNELNSSGTFTEETLFTDLPLDISHLRQILIADIDLNGGGDIILSGTDGVFYALHLDNNGTFDEWTLLPGLETANQIYAGDYDADGLMDIRARLSEPFDHSLAMTTFDTSTQSFTANRILGPISRYYAPQELQINDDAIPDLIDVGGFALNIGNSGFLTAPYLPPPFYNRLSTILAYNAIRGDLNNDGTDELITGFQGIAAYNTNFLSGSSVEGLVLWDTTAACVFDSIHPPLPNGQLTLHSGINQQHSSITPNGHYGFYLPDAPQHILTAVPMSDYWEICPADTILDNDGPHVVHFAASATADCPLMELDLALSSIPQCFSSTVSMAYRNVGTIPAAPVTVTLDFDERMTPIQSTPPWASITDTSLVFEFTAVAAGEEGQIIIEMEPDCQNLILGEVLCYEASITPDTLCDPMLANWDGASLQASYYCAGDSIGFRINNTGNGAMALPEPYQLNIVNDDIVLIEAGDVQLGAGQADTLFALAGTESFLLEIEQPDGHPNPEPISLLTEGCLAPIDTSLLNDFPGSNGDGFVVERCGAVVGPYDPNIKVAIPEGYGAEHFIAADQRIQYTIHFQNVGTDKARTVTIRDALSDQLDLTTFQSGPASHAHEWIILPDRTLSITFPDINLPDSTSNEAESHGFFSYSVEPILGILPYTSIENEAAIYFDFNPPIITNRTIHHIEKPKVVQAIYLTLCPGETYLNTTIEQDTILQELYEFPEKDSIIWHHVNALTIEDTTEIVVTLDEPGIWQGIEIQQDTLISETLTSVQGCDSIVSYLLTIISQLDNPTWAQQITLSPNPAGQVSVLSGGGQPLPSGLVRIYQSSGALWATHYIPSGSQALKLDTGAWPAGVYLVQLLATEERAYWRLIVQ